MAGLGKEKIILSAVPCVFRKVNGEIEWFLVKTDKDKDWELPKTMVKPVESSVRAAIRMLSENAGMDAKVLEEIGRVGGATRINDRIATQRTLYYLMLFKTGRQILGFVEAEWFPHAQTLKKIKAKKDIQFIKDAKAMIKEIEIKRGKPYRDAKLK